MTTRSMPLRKTLLPGLDNVVDNCVYIPTLAIRDSKSSKWSMLGIFGVSVKRNFHYYLRCLQRMQGHSPPKPTVAHVVEANIPHPLEAR
jgi:hypothetical protein